MATGIYKRNPMQLATKEKISKRLLGNKNGVGNKGRKGQVAWNKGIKSPYAVWNKGTKGKGICKANSGSFKKGREGRSGENSPVWKGGISIGENRMDYVVAMTRKRRAWKSGAHGSHTLFEWNALKKFYNYMCLCCKQQEPFIRLTEDHIIPITLGGSHSIENIQPLCRSCNSRKFTNTTDYIRNVTILV